MTVGWGIFLCIAVMLICINYVHSELKIEREERCTHKDSQRVIRIWDMIVYKCSLCGKQFYPFRPGQTWEEYEREYISETRNREAEYARRKRAHEIDKESKRKAKTPKEK